MARSKQRKKHKAHLRQFKQSQDTFRKSRSKAKPSVFFAIVGALVGFAILFFPAWSNVIWTLLGAIAGGLTGFYIGKNFEKKTTS